MQHQHTHTLTHPHTHILLRRLLLRLLLLIAAVVLALGAGEIVARALKLAPAIRAIDTADPKSAYKRSDNPVLGYEIKANHRNPDADFITDLERTNAHGQRDVERSLEKPAGVRRVILLGDSVVESMEVPDIDQVMHRQLERLYPANTVEVLNFGVNGYCTLAEIELLRVKGLAFKPDVVVVVFVMNDFNNFNAAAHAFATNARRPAIVNGLFKRSHLFRSACVRLNLFGFAAERDPVQWNADAIGMNNVLAGLTMLRELADREEFEPVVAVWPIFEEHRITDSPAAEGGDETLIIEQFSRFHGVPCFLLSDYFKQDHASRGASVGPCDTYTVGDGMHANEEGSRVAALALKEVLDALDDPSRADPLPPSAADYARALASVKVMDQTQAEDFRLQSVLVDEVLSVADSLAAEGRLEEATRLYEKIMLMDSEAAANANDRLGNALQAAGRPQEAIPHHREALRLKPDHAEGHNNLGMALVATGQPQEAIPHYQQALQADPGMAKAHLNLGNALQALGRTGEAMEHYRQAVQVQPDYADAHNNLANALLLLGQPAEAIEHYREALRIKPGLADAHYGWGIALGAMGKTRDAGQHFEEALRLKPDHAAARARLRETKGDPR